MSVIRPGLLSFGLCTALLCAGMAQAQLKPLSENELSAARGQGMLILNNSSYGGFDFSRIALGADVSLNANFRDIRLGEYSYAPRNAGGADIDMRLLQFGRSDAGDAARLVQITNPYLEFVYRNAGDAATREVVGMRFGFDSIAGDVGLNIATLSGSMRVDGGAAGVLDSRSDPGGGKRWDGACVAPCLSLSQLGGVRAGNASGPSRDFWISVLKTGVQFQAPTATMPIPDLAQAGFWMNWRDKLTAIATNGVAPPNLPPAR
ncbi:hypothetical protein [Noviherbaspirillum saxi]|uniref:Porin n=1 Tax=Noviherbaspirillum saxi TaxID=2320863 RepID=A0A3A3FXV7_9BURK|nr:hypothetical protein [Noviherbaspirillum saxi]RJF99508.1 hypothetical protein D3871_13970 [Noviherbaspirillum saxi]